MSINLEEKLIQYIQNKIKKKPDFGIIFLENQFLHTIIKEIKNPISISYEEVQNFTQEKFYGKLIFGEIEGKKVVFFIEFSSSFYYENEYPHYFPIGICKKIGINKLIFINTSGIINPNYHNGDVMLVKDHINFFPESPNMKKFLKNNNNFFWIKEPYDIKMLEIAENIAMNHNILIQKGIYVAFPYQNYKTPAEYSMIRSMGGDSIGRNIIPYVMIAKYMNVRVFSISILMSLSEKETSSYSKFIEKNIPILLLIFKEFIKFCD
ncbi:purine-nucleoside phosphorylase [Blattabacterium cuenoti]|uniref:purine-nucleoside phosphorylase n=1 Tax=Blattabacterium cuenoti TaxID=1653831 RepID=UPI00163B7E2F|nr:purine-nucleoside phosphorylase [Blattabacterium cuenoti]